MGHEHDVVDRSVWRRQECADNGAVGEVCEMSLRYGEKVKGKRQKAKGKRQKEKGKRKEIGAVDQLNKNLFLQGKYTI